MTEAFRRLKAVSQRWLFVVALIFVVSVSGCKRSKEPAITGRASDPPVALRPNWKLNHRYVYHVDSIISTQVPRRNTKTFIRAEVSLGQDLAFTVTNVAPDGSRVLVMELLAAQMESGTEGTISASFDTDNAGVFVEGTPMAERLQKLKGFQLVFHMTPENTVKRIDGGKELGSRMGGGNSVRGVAGSVMSRFFNAQFYREVVEMNMLPNNPVKVGEKWTSTRSSTPGLMGTGSPLEITYTFKGWQIHDGTNCARIDFEGVFKPNARTNQNLIRQIASSVVPPPTDEGTLIGRTWYEPDVGLPVETVIDQDIKSTSSTVRRVKTPPSSNTNVAVADVEMEIVTTNLPPAPPASNAPPPVVTRNTTASHQHIAIKLVEFSTVDPLAAPPK